MILISNNGRMIVQRWMFWTGVVVVALGLAGGIYAIWRYYRTPHGIEQRYQEAKEDFTSYTDTVYMPRRDRVIELTKTLRITDTVEVKEFVRACTSALSACDSALFKARAAIAAGDSALKAAKRTPFAESYGVVLYDPLHQVPTARLGIGIKPRSRVSVLLEGEQRFTPGESPRINAGVRMRF